MRRELETSFRSPASDQGCASIASRTFLRGASFASRMPLRDAPFASRMHSRDEPCLPRPCRGASPARGESPARRSLGEGGNGPLFVRPPALTFENPQNCTILVQLKTDTQQRI